MKKILYIFLLVIILSALTPVISHAEELDKAQISIHSTDVMPGEIFDIDIKIQNNPGIISANFKVSFDSGLTLVKAVNGEAFSSLTYISPRQLSTIGHVISDCRFVWQGFDINDADIKNGTVLTLSFKVAEEVEIGDTFHIFVTSEKGDVIDRNLNSIVLSTCGIVTAGKHSLKRIPEKIATCTMVGNIEYYICSVCGKFFLDSKGTKEITSASTEVKAQGHTYDGKRRIIRATVSENGKVMMDYRCLKCNHSYGKMVETIVGISKIEFSKACYTYNGKVHKPVLLIRDRNNKTISRKYYTIQYLDSGKKVGTHIVKIVFRGKYRGCENRSFKIVPNAPANLRAERTSSGIRLTWKKVSNVTEYSVYCSTNRNRNFKKLATIKGTKLTCNKLSKKTKYYFKVVAIKKVKGKNYISRDKTISVK